MQQLAARLRPQLEEVVKQNESAAGDTFVPGDFNQVQPCRTSAYMPSLHADQQAMSEGDKLYMMM